MGSRLRLNSLVIHGIPSDTSNGSIEVNSHQDIYLPCCSVNPRDWGNSCPNETVELVSFPGVGHGGAESGGKYALIDSTLRLTIANWGCHSVRRGIRKRTRSALGFSRGAGFTDMIVVRPPSTRVRRTWDRSRVFVRTRNKSSCSVKLKGLGYITSIGSIAPARGRDRCLRVQYTLRVIF